MLSRLIGTDRMDELASELAALRAELAGQGRKLAELTALRSDVARLMTRVEHAADESEALRRAVEELGRQVVRMEAQADDHRTRIDNHEERSRMAERQSDEASVRAEAEREAQRLDLRKFQMRLDAYSDDMVKTANALVRQMAALRVDERGHAAGSPRG